MQRNVFVDHSECVPHGAVCISALFASQNSHRTRLFISASLGCRLISSDSETVVCIEKYHFIRLLPDP